MLLSGLLQNEKSWKKRVSRCNSVAVKTMKVLQNFRITLPFPFRSSQLSPTPHMPRSYISLYECIIVAHTMAVSQNSIQPCVFLFYFKIFMQSTLIYTMNLLKPYLFQSSNDIWCSVRLRQINAKQLYLNLRRIRIIFINFM